MQEPIRKLLSVVKIIALSAFLTLTASHFTLAETLEFQKAAKFTHLKWPAQLEEPVKIKLTPLLNYSGIPIERRTERVEYYYYGKLPFEINDIVKDAFNASRYFTNVNEQADYQVELSIDEYHLPFDYAADDEWWNKLHDQADRWLQEPAATQVTLTIKLKSGTKPIKPWMQSVTMALSPCDLNRFPQPATMPHNQDKTRKKYLSTTPGQTLLAATNYLILQTKIRLSQEPIFARVVNKYEQEIHLRSNTNQFTNGQKVQLYSKNEDNSRAEFSLGELQVFKTQGSYAIAYPINLRADHINNGDWVKLGYSTNNSLPDAYYKPLKNCANVVTAQR